MNCPTFFSAKAFGSVTPRFAPSSWVNGIVIGAVLYAITLATAQTPQSPGVMKATRFVLVDDDGKERAVLGFNGQSVGLYIYPRSGEKDAEPFISLETRETRVVYPTRGEGTQEDARLAIRNGFTPTVGSLSANSIQIMDTKRNERVGLTYINSPSLVFVDRSGYPYVWLRHDETNGVEFEIRSPLGIEGAFEQDIKASLQGEKGDPRIDEALHRSLRFRFTAPPFANPTMALSKDGRAIWNAKGE